VTQATETTVNGAGQTLGTTLTVASTTGFGTSGKFTIAGLNGVCSYTGTTPTTFTGISGCTGKPQNSAKITKIAKLPGIYKWNDSTHAWDVQSPPNPIPTGETFPASPSDGDYFRIAEHEIGAEARSAPTGDSSTVSIAGALALNIVSNHTTATVAPARR
jgi:hypothetical protein